MFGLDRSSRALVASAAFAAFAGAFVTTPLVARGAPDLAPVRALIAAPSSAPLAFADVLPRRDPFAGDPAAARAAAAPGKIPIAAVTPTLPLPQLPALPGALGALPPNAGAAAAPFPFAAQSARVTAVVTGAQPFALVEDAGSTRLVTLGDRVGGDEVAAITAAGVRLAHGAVLAVAPASSPLPPALGGR